MGTTKNIIDSIMNDVKEYCYNVYNGDDMMEKEILNTELRSLGILNGENEMVWKSPDNSICFEVSREYSSVKSVFAKGYQCICTLTIKNNLGIVLDVSKFTEIDAIRILDLFVYFNEPDYISDDHNVVYIDIPPHDTNMENRTIVLEQILSGPATSVLFTLQKYNPFYQQIVPIVKIPMTYEQLNDLAFHIFFAILIDLEVPEEFNETMFRIEDYVTTENYWIYAQRRQELQKFSQQYPEKGKYGQSFINNNSYYVESFLTDNECYSEPEFEVPMNTIIQNPIEKKHKRKVVMQLNKKRG